ncbi:VWA-like domain-containing protein [Nannocystis sp. ncelm1]|uniref:VWA-like domain-containing protein n=1 Tax=Nannocystis radixulma TaxID=2995305 RepID=A0ABT5BBJ6_9BACT|nr:VWA-like domain-containing protein [Nannocystis radixulma]MDC0671503.1 VWA-like domain-containing protein [Nannocystis radixulma]
MTLDAFFRRCLSQGLAYHQSEGRGLLPAGLVEEIRALAQPPIPWDVELAKWFDERFSPLERRRSFARASRRQSATPDIPRPMWVPGLDNDDGRTFGVLLDTSGSMDRKLLAKALGAIASYAIARDVSRVRVVFCDAAVYDEGYLPPEVIADRVRVRGRGGTILQPGIDLLERAEDFPPAGPLLIITDGMCDRLHVRRDHAFLVPEGRHLPFGQGNPGTRGEHAIGRHAVRDDPERACGGEVLGALEQIDPRLQDGAAAAAHAHAVRDHLRRQVALVVHGGVAEHHAHARHVAGDRIAGDRTERLGQQLAVHRARRVEQHAEGAPVVVVEPRHPHRPRDVGVADCRRLARAKLRRRSSGEKRSSNHLASSTSHGIGGCASARISSTSPAGRRPPPLALVVREPLGQAAAKERVERHALAALPHGLVAEHVAEVKAAKGSELAVAAEVDDDAIVDRLGREPLELRVVQEPERGQLADPHLDQPAVDHEVARDVPQVRISTLAAGLVAQPDVQQFVGDDESGRVVVEVGRGVDVQLARLASIAATVICMRWQTCGSSIRSNAAASEPSSG